MKEKYTSYVSEIQPGVPSSQPPFAFLQDLAVREKLPPLFLQGLLAGCDAVGGLQFGFFGFVADFQQVQIDVQNIPSFYIRRHSLFNILHIEGVY